MSYIIKSNATNDREPYLVDGETPNQGGKWSSRQRDARRFKTAADARAHSEAAFFRASNNWLDNGTARILHLIPRKHVIKSRAGYLVLWTPDPACMAKWSRRQKDAMRFAKKDVLDVVNGWFLKYTILRLIPRVKP